MIVTLIVLSMSMLEEEIGVHRYKILNICKIFIFVTMCSVYHCSLYFPRNHDENKVNSDLYDVIPTTQYF